MAFYSVKQSSTAYPLKFLLVSSTDHISGVTGLTPTVTIQKGTGAFASPAGAVSELGNGWYAVAGNATDTNTLGGLILHATGTGADPADVVYEVVAVDPQAVGYGLTLGTDALPAASVSAAAAAKIADVTLRRNLANVKASADGDNLSLHSLYGVTLLPLKYNTAGGIISVFDLDDILLGTITGTTTPNDNTANLFTGGDVN